MRLLGIESRLDSANPAASKHLRVSVSPTNVLELTPSPIFGEIENVLASKEDAEACQFLKDTVSDLLQESDELHVRIHEQEEEIRKLKKENDASSKEERLMLQSILTALANISRDEKKEIPCLDTISKPEAIELVVKSMATKVETLNAANTELEWQNKKSADRVAELESEKIAFESKIQALENQFNKINKTRQKVVSRIMDRVE